jgi:hypothetical protein
MGSIATNRTIRLRLLSGRRALTWLGIVVVLSLSVFHVVLFAERIRDLSILTPGVAFQWAGAGLLLVSLAFLKWKRVPLLRGKTALAFWLVVLLLHLVPAAPATTLDSGHSELLLGLPTVWLAATVLGLILLTLVRKRIARSNEPTRTPRRFDPCASTRPGFADRILARPPPFAPQQ